LVTPLPPFQNKPLLFPKLRELGFGLRDNFCSKSKPLVTLTRVHLFHVCHFQMEQFLHTATIHTKKYQTSFSLNLLSCDRNHMFTVLQ
jgi:hypothetical protein